MAIPMPCSVAASRLAHDCGYDSQRRGLLGCFCEGFRLCTRTFRPKNLSDESSANCDGIESLALRMDWSWKLSKIAGLQGEPEKQVISLYKDPLSYQMKSMCSWHWSRAEVLIRDVFKFDNWAGAIKPIRHAENDVQRDINRYSIQHTRFFSLDVMARQAASQCACLQDIRCVIQEHTKKQEESGYHGKDEECRSGLS